MVRSILSVVVAVPLLACPAPATALGRARDTAQEFNLDARYARTEVAIEHVAVSARASFLAQHKAWGTSIRIADVEVSSMHATSEREVQVIVHATWYRPDEEDLRSTTLSQTWKDQGGWELTSEQHLDGDVGLLGETVVREVPTEPAPRRYFPTVRLAGDAP